jgi:hypothetical protein
MKKKVYFLFVIINFCLSCTTLNDLDMYRSKGDSIVTTYDYDWNNVYDAITIVLNNDESLSLYFNEIGCTLEYTKSEKRIWVKTESLGIGAGIYFIPLSNSKTKVEYVGSRFHKYIFNDKKIEQIFKKSMDILNQNNMGWSS